LAPGGVSKQHQHPRGRLPSNDAGQFIGTQDVFAFLGQFRGLAIQGVDVFNLLVELIIGDWRQPIAHLVRFEISIFLRASPHVWARSGQRCHVS
ncbi:MAG: hypothetical protein ACE5OS_12860, partial [Anaerolineae bacterium]